jgi:hypothetical protein
MAYVRGYTWMHSYVCNTRAWAFTFLSFAITLRNTRFNTQKLYMLITLPLCVLYGSQNKQQTFPYTTLTDRNLQPMWRVFTARYGMIPYITRILLRSVDIASVYNLVNKARRLRWSSGLRAGLWFPSSRVRTRPKPLDFFCVKKSSALLPSEGKLNHFAACERTSQSRCITGWQRNSFDSSLLR